MNTLPSKRDDARLARAFHTLADEKRLQIIRLLRHGERCVCELTGALAAGQSLLSFHLKVLKEAGLVTDRREGRWVFYSLAQPVFVDVSEFVLALASVEAVQGSPARCE